MAETGRAALFTDTGQPYEIREIALPVALDFLRRTRDKYPVHKVVSHKFPLEQINEAFQEAEWANKQTAVTRACIVP